MRVGIVEVCEPNHYTAVSALAKTYLTDPNNSVIIFTTESIKPLFADLAIDIVTQKPDQDVAGYLSAIAGYPLDRIHINTISRYYKEFAQTNWQHNIYFTVHNIDIWYDNPVQKRLKTLLYDYRASHAGLKGPLIIFIKDFWRQRFRDAFVKQLLKKEYKILVYSQSQKRHLEKYVDERRILAFPFCLYTLFEDLSESNTTLRLCIPGSVTNQRRNYSELFESLKRNLSAIKFDITIDLLGYIPKDQRFLIDEIESLKSLGFAIIYNEAFISTEEFDERLSHCDLILGNLKVQMNVFRKYGETKETGVTFNMIKSGKPGILPGEYPVDEELKNICLFFDGYVDLCNLIKVLVADKQTVKTLKARAKDLVKNYQPENLYKQLEA